MGFWEKLTGIGLGEDQSSRVGTAAITFLFTDLTMEVGEGVTVPMSKTLMNLDAGEQAEFDALVSAAVTLGNAGEPSPRKVFALALSHLIAAGEPGVDFPGGAKPAAIATAAGVRLRAADYVDSLGGDGSALRA